ncbi:MAG: DNA translocase FtsK 4TM domain-containing protein, partial [Caldimicrobium sp.]
MKAPFKKAVYYLSLFLVFLFLSLSIYSYVPTDPGIGIIGTEEIRNYGGLIGAILSSL